MSTLYQSDLSGGINQNTAPNLVSANESPLLVNTTQDESGNVAHRLGSDLLKRLSTSTNFQGMGTLKKTDGTQIPMIVAGGYLYKYDEDSNTYVQLGTSTTVTQEAETSTRSGTHVAAQYDYFAQSFTAGITGTLTQVDVLGRCDSDLYTIGSTQKVDVWVYNDTAGSPGSTILWNGSGTNERGLLNLTFDPVTPAWASVTPGLAVTSGTTYWFVVRASSDNYAGGSNYIDVHWRYSNANPYASGAAKEVLNNAASTPSGLTWSAIATSDFCIRAYISDTTAAVNTSSKVSFANYLGRLYFIGSAEADYLKYTDGAAFYSVTGNIAGKYLTAGNDRLVVAGDGRRNYYSNVGTDTFTTASDYIDFDAPTTGITSLGENAPFLGYDQDSMYIFDPNTGSSRPVKGGFGCVSHRTIKVIQGAAIWLNRDGFYMFSGDMAYPRKISTAIENNVTYDAIFNKIDGAEFAIAAAGTYKNKYYCSVGNLSGTVKGETLNDCWIVFDIRQNTFHVRTYTTNGAGLDFTNWMANDGTEYFLCGARDDESVYKVDINNLYTDDTGAGVATAFSALYQSKHFEFTGNGVGPEVGKVLNALHLKLDTAAALTVKYALNGDDTYSAWSTTGTTAAGKNWHREEIAPFATGAGDVKELSVQVSGTGQWALHDIGFDIQTTGGTQLQIR